MPIALHDKVREKLRGLAREALAATKVGPHGIVEFGSFFQLNKKADKLLGSLPKAEREKIDTWIGSLPAFTFFRSKIADRVDGDAIKEEMQLSTLPGFDDVDAVADQLVEEFLLLPENYVVSFPLPEKIAQQVRALNLPPIVNGAFGLIGSWHEAHPDFPQQEPHDLRARSTESGLGGLFAFRPAQTTVLTPATLDNLSAQFHVEGYVSRNGTPTETEALSSTTFKAFVGLAMALGSFEDATIWAPATLAPVGKQYVQQRLANGWASIKTLDLAERERNLLGAMTCEVNEPEELLGSLQKLARLFGGEAGMKLKLAGRWLFDSAVSSDPPMKYMQLAIAAEVLLGSNPGDEGLTKALATRCAYLVATSASERESISKEFVNLYGLRSKIVHNGADRLAVDEHRMLERLRQLCGRIVASELKLALADIDLELQRQAKMVELLRSTNA